ncbi:SDR family NAD(P)-dependent oxidoreductase [Mycobacterium noviomagense]|uniref:Short-chain dehydrogenase n=1 Tax=Mycobacterium noviomagense TaxID=459858 RepID=A0A7I7PKA2_9MYCO|nr:SDR family NAD(P)-dependent oxidoreductase [Mycobacterium noviomagense]ORB12283.1 short-chain dehydrogenase [Mycobacterium noviomagense]BBY09053.1 short-chain dehydrogenase [Mycobacterium noviomagense]
MTSSALWRPRHKSVVITGASSGLGRAAALHLADLGYRVFAGVRSQSSAEDLVNLPPSAGELIPVLLDVTDATSVARAGDHVELRCADTGLWAVVNNAGVCVGSPLECLPIDELRTQLETNLVGVLQVTQRFLPLLRASKGRIVNVSSSIGNVAPPFLGAYAASEFGKEGLSDALRRELGPLGVRVSVIEPGVVETPIWRKLRASAEQIIATAPADIAATYRSRFTAFLDAHEKHVYASKTTPLQYANAVAAALVAKRPKTRYRVGRDSWLSAVTHRVTPDPVLDVLIALAISRRR